MSDQKKISIEVVHVQTESGQTQFSFRVNGVDEPTEDNQAEIQEQEQEVYRLIEQYFKDNNINITGTLVS